MLRCLGCDTINESGASSCKRCGSGIASACAQCGAGNPVLARFCGGCGGRLETTSTSLAPVSLSQPERRRVTVLFCDLVGSTPLSRALDPEDWHRLLHRLHSQCGEVIAEHHGHVAQFLGDGLVAYFGYPVAAQGDARRAVRAGLALLEQANKLAGETQHSIRLRVGLHTGPVVIGNIGSIRHQESLALGETPNLAARIQDLAPPNSVVISPDTHRLVQPFFRFEPLGPLTPKGFAEPITLHRILGETGVATRLEAASARGLTPLVGRGGETVVMRDAWQEAVGGGTPIVLLVGEAGLGKSRLIHGLKEELEAEGARVIELRCAEHTRTSAFHPVLEALRRLAGLRHGEPASEVTLRLSALLRDAGLPDAHVPWIASLFGVPPPADQAPTPAAVRGRVLESLSQWIAHARTADPTLFIVEDLHWADPSTLELLGTVVERSPGGRRLTVLSARPEFTANWLALEQVRTISPTRLDTADTSRMIELVAGGKPLPPDVVERVRARAEGIPLFIEEMTKSILDSGMLRETASGFELDALAPENAIPATIHDSLMSRLDQLGHCKPVAQLAAVLGREFSFALLEAVWRRLTPMPRVDLVAALERIAEGQLIARRTEGGETSYQFRHSLLQDAAYESLLRSARREYHRQAAQALLEDFAAQSELQPELVARHYTAAQMAEPAVEYWSKAGQRAIGTSAYAEAGSHYGAAIEQLAATAAGPRRSRQELDLRIALGVTLITTRGYAAQEVEETYSRATVLCDELGTELPLRVLYGVWVVNFVRGNLASARRMVTNLERLVQQASDAASSLVAHAALSAWAFWQGHYEKLAAYHRVTSSLIDDAQPKRQHEAFLQEHGFEGLLYPRLYYAWSQVVTGDTEGGLATWREAEALVERMGDPYLSCLVLSFGAAIQRDVGNAALEGELAERAGVIAAEKGFVFWLALSLGHRGLALVAQHDLDGGIAKIREALAIFEKAGVLTTYSYFLCYLGEAYIAGGRLDQAIEVLGRALELSHAHVDANYEPEILRLVGEARFARGELSAARESLRRGLDRARAQGARLFELRAATSLARVLRAAGEGADAKRLLGDVRASFAGAPDSSTLRNADVLLTEL